MGLVMRILSKGDLTHHSTSDYKKSNAMQARNLARRMLGQARRIDLHDAARGKYFRIVARVVADGKDVGRTLIARGLAVEYDGGTKTKNWCADDLSHSPPAPEAILASPMVSVGLTL